MEQTSEQEWPSLSATNAPCFMPIKQKIQPNITPMSGLWKTHSMAPIGFTEYGTVCYVNDPPTFLGTLFHGKPFNWAIYQRDQRIKNWEKLSEIHTHLTASELYEDSWNLHLARQTRQHLKKMAKQTAQLAVIEFERRKKLREEQLRKTLAKKIGLIVMLELSIRRNMECLETETYDHMQGMENAVERHYPKNMSHEKIRTKRKSQSTKYRRHNKHCQRQEKKHNKKRNIVERENKMKRRNSLTGPSVDNFNDYVLEDYTPKYDSDSDFDSDPDLDSYHDWNADYGRDAFTSESDLDSDDEW